MCSITFDSLYSELRNLIVNEVCYRKLGFEYIAPDHNNRTTTTKNPLKIVSIALNFKRFNFWY